MSDEPTAELANFGKYLLDEELARGGMSRVYRARLRGPGGFEKQLVVKQILPELAQDPAFVELFVREAKTLVQMSHPNLVPVYELGVIDGVYFLAMEWVEGATVAELLDAGALSEALVAQIGAQIAEALDYAHERFQIIHRDVTPRNIIVDGAGHARLLDFGIAAPVEHTGKGELFGSPGYMAPEQARGEALSPASDLFALGTVLYEALSGRPAWPVTRVAGGFRTSEVAPPPLTAAEPALARIVSQLLEREPAQRPKRASEVADALRTWLAERHPRGVRTELAERAARAHAARAALPRPLSQPPPTGSSGRIEVRSIAVSPELSQLLSHATERIERIERIEPAAPAPDPRALEPDTMAEDPEMHRVVRRFIRDIAVITVALIVAIYYGLSAAQQDQAAVVATSEAGDPRARPTPTEHVPLKGAREPVKAERAAAAPGAEPSAAISGKDPNASAAPSALPSSPAANSGKPSTAVSDHSPRRSNEHSQPPAAVSGESPADPGDSADAPAKRPALLSVSAAPWAQVRVDGRDMGVTPRRSLQLRPGKHLLTLSCPPLDREARVPIELSPGQELHVAADLHESPPQVSVH
jgi:serine/threonine protein kinase